MTNLDIIRQRLHNQLLTQHPFEQPADVVRWFGAMQGEDYTGGLWALGLRLPETSEADVEQAVVKRTVVRTWPMRGTLHFVASEDIRWMLKLLTPRVIARSAGLYRKAGVDDAIFAQSRDVLIKALQGSKQLTRRAMFQVLEDNHISTANQRGRQITVQLAQEGLICFGSREGKQPTFVLLDEWVPTAKMMERDEALAELTRRYFASHGPASVHDFAWWSGLTMADVKAGLEMAQEYLVKEVIDGQTYWLSSSMPTTKVASPTSPTAYLLPPVDEFTVAYKDRSPIADPPYAQLSSEDLGATIVVDGKLVGTWKRTFRKGTVVIAVNPFTTLTAAEDEVIAAAARRYGEFLKMPVVLP
jgi:hypothetical protein